MPISYLYVEIKQKPHERNTCSNDESTTFYIFFFHNHEFQFNLDI
jgi:hypothetical protein